MTLHIASKAGGLVARMLEEAAAKQPPQSDRVALPTLPESVHMSAWYEQHVALLHQFLHRALKVVANTPSRRNTQLIQRFGETHAELMQHTRKIAGDAIPAVLSRDGQYLIPFDRLAEARAKVKALTAEIALAREEMDTLKVEGWQPAFDVMSPRQEELVIQFCQEIAGRKGEPGSPPDPVRLLEMAQALYEAERDTRRQLPVPPRQPSEKQPVPQHAVHWLPPDDTEGGAP